MRDDHYRHKFGYGAKALNHAVLDPIETKPRARTPPTHFHWCPKCNPDKTDRKCAEIACKDLFEKLCEKHA